MLQIETTETDDTVEKLMLALREVIDPEIGLNIVALGLLYHIRLLSEEVHVSMTMTTPACPMGDYLRRQVEQAVRGALPNVQVAEVEVVWDPPWSPALMTPEAKALMGWGSRV